MKTLTYGTLPGFKAFEAAFIGATGGIYHIRLSVRDMSMFDTIGLEPYAAEYTCEELYSLLEALVAAYDGSEPLDCDADDVADTADWAGDFASSILTTLGFEWI
jgi:hypothetical protein